MKRAHSRVVLAMGGEVAFAEMLERLPLSPQDHDIINLSAEVAGWSDDLMARPKAKAKAKAAGLLEAQHHLSDPAGSDWHFIVVHKYHQWLQPNRMVQLSHHQV